MRNLILFSLLLLSCGKSNDPVQPPTSEARITSFEVLGAETTFRGDTILVRLSASYTGTTITPTVTFTGGESLAPQSGNVQVFERQPPLRYGIYLGNARFKEYLVIVVPSMPPKLEWVKSAERIYPAYCGKNASTEVLLENVGTVTDRTTVRVTIPTEPNLPVAMLTADELLFRQFPSVAFDRKTPTGTYIGRAVIEVNNGLTPARQGTGINQINLTATPYIPVIGALYQSKMGVFLGCGDFLTKSYSIRITDAQNRVYTQPATWAAPGQVFQVPAFRSAAAGPANVQVLEEDFVIFEGMTEVKPN